MKKQIMISLLGLVSCGASVIHCINGSGFVKKPQFGNFQPTVFIKTICKSSESVVSAQAQEIAEALQRKINMLDSLKSLSDRQRVELKRLRACKKIDIVAALIPTSPKQSWSAPEEEPSGCEEVAGLDGGSDIMQKFR